VHKIDDRRRGLGLRLRALRKSRGDGAKKNKSNVSHRQSTSQRDDELMNGRANNKCATVVAFDERRRRMEFGPHRAPLQL